MSEREAFDAWLDETSGFTKDDEAVAWAAWQAATEQAGRPEGWTLVPNSPHIGLLATGGFYVAAAHCEPGMTAQDLYQCVLREARERYQREFGARPSAVLVPAAKAGILDAAAFIERKADDYAREFGSNDMGSLSFGNEDMRIYHWHLVELADEIRGLATESQARGGDGE